MARQRTSLRITRRTFVAGAATIAASSGWLGALRALGAPAPAASPAPTPGGTLRVAIGADPGTLDPQRTTILIDEHMREALFDGLVDSDTTQGVRGALAESWEAPDASTYTFRLRRGVRFHDGTELTANVVKSSMERILNPATQASGQVKPVVDQIANIDVVDQSTIRFRLKAPNSVFPIDLTDAKVVPPNFDPTRPVGTGAFEFVEWVRLQRIRMKKFAGHWRQGRPYVDELVFVPAPDENQKLVLLEAGQVEAIDSVSLARVREVEQSGKSIVIGVEPGVSPSSFFMPIRADRPPLDSVKVRQAINYAIDRKALLTVLFGKSTLKSNPVPPKNWAFNPAAASFNERNLTRARQLMAEAGHGSGFPVTLKHLTVRQEYFSMAQILQANLAEINLRVELVPQTIPVFVQQVLLNRDFELGLTGVTPRYDPDAMLGQQFSTGTTNGRAIGWRHELFEKLLTQGRARAVQSERKRVYDQAQLILQWESPGLILNERPILLGASSRVQGLRADVRQQLRLENAWLKR